MRHWNERKRDNVRQKVRKTEKEKCEDNMSDLIWASASQTTSIIQIYVNTKLRLRDGVKDSITKTHTVFFHLSSRGRTWGWRYGSVYLICASITHSRARISSQQQDRLDIPCPHRICCFVSGHPLTFPLAPPSAQHFYEFQSRLWKYLKFNKKVNKQGERQMPTHYCLLAAQWTSGGPWWWCKGFVEDVWNNMFLLFSLKPDKYCFVFFKLSLVDNKRHSKCVSATALMCIGGFQYAADINEPD